MSTAAARVSVLFLQTEQLQFHLVSVCLNASLLLLLLLLGVAAVAHAAT